MFARPSSSVVAASRVLKRGYATTKAPNVLLLIEHRNGAIEGGTLAALTAAGELGGDVTGLVIGGPDQLPSIVEKAKKLQGLKTVLHASAEQYAAPVPEVVSPLLEKLLGAGSAYTHFASAHSSAAKALVPRLAARLDVQHVPDITALSHGADGTTFTRPIYAGNAIASIRAPASLPVTLFTVRGTAFAAAADGADAPAEALDAVPVPDAPSTHIKTSLTQSDRPELGVASRVVSGGRALKNAETFKGTLEPLADALGAAIGASRAAVDAGYADNSLQVGQTGQVVAPALYVAVGISGAIQHLAGMKDSKMIVAINKDADAPIFQVADAGLVADLYEAVPDLVEKLKASK